MKKRNAWVKALALISAVGILGGCGSKDTAESVSGQSAESTQTAGTSEGADKTEASAKSDDSGKTASAGDKTDSGKTDSGKTDSGKTDSGKTGSSESKDTESTDDKKETESAGTESDSEGVYWEDLPEDAVIIEGDDGQIYTQDENGNLVLVIDGLDWVWTEEDEEEDWEDDEARLDGRSNANEGTGSPKVLKEGDIAPDFTIYTNYGDEFTLSDYDEDVVLINFWATWCGPCVGEMPALEMLDDEGDAIIIGINCGEDMETVDEFLEENEYTYYVGYDEDGTVQIYYPTDGIPYTLIVNRGIIYKIYTGASDWETMYQEYGQAIAECLE